MSEQVGYAELRSVRIIMTAECYTLQVKYSLLLEETIYGSV